MSSDILVSQKITKSIYKLYKEQELLTLRLNRNNAISEIRNIRNRLEEIESELREQREFLFLVLVSTI